MYFFKTFWWPTPVFLDCLYFIKTRYEYIIFAWGLRVNLWSSSGLEACLPCIRDNLLLVEAKVRRGVVPFSPHWELDSAETEICMDNPHFLPNNPARKKYRYIQDTPLNQQRRQNTVCLQSFLPSDIIPRLQWNIKSILSCKITASPQLLPYSELAPFPDSSSFFLEATPLHPCRPHSLHCKKSL